MVTSLGLDFGGARFPAIMTDCSDPGRSIRYTVGRGGCCTCAIDLVGTFPRCQPANSCSSRGRISARVVAPTTTMVAWFGLNHEVWKRTRSSRLILAVDSSVPEPVHGLA